MYLRFEYKGADWASKHIFVEGNVDSENNVVLAFVPGMLGPNSDYWYRCAILKNDNSIISDILYNNESSYAKRWASFRTEKNFVLYPPTPYTMVRTDRETNSIVFCGYFNSGSEPVLSCGYYYWQLNNSARSMGIPADAVRVVTGTDMEYTASANSFEKGAYAVIAFVETESGTELGNQVNFEVSPYVSGVVDEISLIPMCEAGTGSVTIRNVQGLSGAIYDVNGYILRKMTDMADEVTVRDLPSRSVLLIRLSDGSSFKVLTK